MRTVWFTRFWERNETAHLTKREAVEFAASHPHMVGHADVVGETIEFSEVVKGTLPAIVKCKTCKAAGRDTIVTAEDPVKYPFCKNCFYTGAAAEFLMSDVMVKIGKGVKGWEPSVWHTGGGCFALVLNKWDPEKQEIVKDGEYYMLTGDDFEVSTIATEGVGCIGRYLDETEDNKTSEYAGTRMCMVYEGYDWTTADGTAKKITLDQAIARIQLDIKNPAPFTETH
jgi:hypothetical protein